MMKEKFTLWNITSESWNGVPQGLEVSEELKIRIKIAMSEKLSEDELRPYQTPVDQEQMARLVQTIASAITVMGYDEVIQADAKARAAKILQQANPNKELKTKLTELVKRLEEVEKLAHHSGVKKDE